MKLYRMFIFAVLLLVSCGSLDPEAKKEDLKSLTHPTLGMTLGRGFDPTKPLEPKGDCIANVRNATIESWRDANGIHGQFTETRIHSHEDLLREMSMSANLAGEALWGSVSAAISKYEKFRSNENSFTWLVKFTVESGEKTLDGSLLKLTDAAQALVTSGRLEEFYQMCGTEYVRSIKMGGRFSTVYEIESKYTELVSKLTASINAHVSGLGWGFSGSSSFQSFFRDAIFKSVLKKEIEQLGGDSLDTSSITPENLGTYLISYQRELRSRNSAVINVETAGWETLGVRNLNSFALWSRKEIVYQLYQKYRRNLALLQRIGDYFSWQSEGKFTFSSESMKNLNTSKLSLDKQQVEITKKADACIEQNKCDASNLDELGVTWPELIEPIFTTTFAGFSFEIPQSWAAYASDDYENRVQSRTYEVPPHLLLDSKIQQLSLILYTTHCPKGAWEWISSHRNRLLERSIPVNEIAPIASKVPAYSIHWYQNHFSQLEAFENPHKNGECAVLKVGASGTLDSLESSPHLYQSLYKLASSLQF